MLPFEPFCNFMCKDGNNQLGHPLFKNIYCIYEAFAADWPTIYRKWQVTQKIESWVLRDLSERLCLSRDI